MAAASCCLDTERAWLRETAIAVAFQGLDRDGRAITQHLRDPRHHFGGIVPDADDGIGPSSLGMGAQNFEGVRPGSLAQ